MTQNPTQRRPSPPIPFSWDPHPVRSTGQCRVRVSVSWTDPQLNNGFQIRDPQSSSSLCHHLTSAPALWEQDQGPRGKAMPSTLVGARPPLPAPAFLLLCLFWPSLWHSGLGRNAGSPGPPPPILHSGPLSTLVTMTPTAATGAQEALSLKEASSVASSGSRGCGRDSEHWWGWGGMEGGEGKGGR